MFCVYRAKIANICRDLLLRLLERDDFYCAGNLIVFFRREMDDPLVRASAEMELRVFQSLDERAVNENVNVWEEHGKPLVRTDFFYGESGPAPDGLIGFGLDSPGQCSESLHLIERVASAERNIAEFVVGYHLHQVIDAHLVSVLEFP